MRRKKIDAPTLAAAAEVTPQSVYAWIKDQSAPRADRLSTIATALGVSIAELLGEPSGRCSVLLPGGDNETAYKRAGERLRLLRQIISTSPEDFAGRLGISAEEWLTVEDAKCCPGLSLMTKVCLDHGITLDFVMYGRLDGIDERIQLELWKRHPELIEEDPTRSASQKPRTR